jgi:N utilization substance protein B
MQKKSKPTYRKRTLSRLVAIQIFYQFEFYEKKIPLAEVKNNVIDNYVLEQEETISSYRKKIDLNLLETLLAGINLGVEEIDHDIFGLLKSGWDLEKLPDVMLYILRLGAFELKFMHDIPLKVVLDEYVDISASFFEAKKVTFLNATLENLAKHYRAAEFEKVKTRKNV